MKFAWKMFAGIAIFYGILAAIYWRLSSEIVGTAQDKAGMTIAEQVQLALAGDFVPFAVNVAAGDVSNAVRPFMGPTSTP